MLQEGILKSNHLLFDKLFKQKETHELGMVENHMPPWGVVGKKKCCCQFVLKFQEGKDHKPNNYDWNYKNPIP